MRGAHGEKPNSGAQQNQIGSVPAHFKKPEFLAHVVANSFECTLRVCELRLIGTLFDIGMTLPIHFIYHVLGIGWFQGIPRYIAV